MQKIITTVILSASLVFVACGGKNEGGTLADKKKELDKLKSEQAANDTRIKALEKEIAKLDTSAGKSTEDNAKLVSLATISTQNFAHYIDLQGRVDADNISYISPRMGGGQVKALYVKRGDFVKKGQLLLKMDDAIVSQQVAASKQSVETLRTQYNLAKDVYNRRNNLWKQGIGTEVELITAKTNMDALDKQIKAAEENIKVQQEQQSMSNVYSDVDGIADEVNVRVGEMFTGFSGTAPQIKIVNTNSLKVVIDVPENYSAKVRKGSAVVVTLPDVNKTFNETITLSGQVIDPNNRSFRAEAKLPNDPSVRPNQIAQVRILDYSASNAITVPVNTVGTDEKGKYVFIAVNEGGKLVARKKVIVAGEQYGDQIEARSGLTAGDQLITDGYQGVYDGQVLKTDTKK